MYQLSESDYAFLLQQYSSVRLGLFSRYL